MNRSHLPPSLQGPLSEELARSLPDIGETLHAQLDELSARPTADGAEQLAINLDGARRAVLRLRERLMLEGGDDGQGR